MFRILFPILAAWAMLPSANALANRCNYDGLWVTIDGNHGFISADSGVLNHIYNELLAHGVCDDLNRRLSVDFPYITLDGKEAFGPYAPNDAATQAEMLRDLIALAEGSAGTPGTRICTATITDPGFTTAQYIFTRNGKLFSTMDRGMGRAFAVKTYLHYLADQFCLTGL
jgi:hypothetical protein